MYKIWINDTPLFLCDNQEWQSLPEEEHRLMSAYTGDRKFFLQHIDMLEKTDRFDAVVLYADDFDSMVDDFRHLYEVVLAAGGVVFNEQEEIALIFKRGLWDLPKGKINEEETAEEAALREVREETGLKELDLGPFLSHSYHTYQRDDARKLKKTVWFLMHSGQRELHPQTEEQIQEARWTDPVAFLDQSGTTYPSVQTLLHQAVNSR